MRRLEINNPDPTFQETTRAVQIAAADLIGFAVSCCVDSLRAETQVQETLLVALENSWFTYSMNHGEEFTHLEFREEIFQHLWRKIITGTGRSQGIRPFAEADAPFFKLDLKVRAALYLRARSRFTYEQIARILGLESAQLAESMVAQARRELLGHDIAQGPDSGELW